MSGVEEMKFGVGNVAEIGARAVGQEDGIVLSPQDQRRRPMFAHRVASRSKLGAR